jgi:hypothetical protein
MNYLKINGVDFSSIVSGLKIGFETLVSDQSGRNANGDMVIEVLRDNIINKKAKVYVTLRHTTQAEMQSFMSAISDYVVTVEFLNPKTAAPTSITAYTGTPEPEYYTIQPNHIIYKPMNLNFIEL